MTVPVSYAVEGIVDQAVVLKLFEASGIVPGTPYVCDGIDNLRQRLPGFNAGARYSPWFVLCDLDRHECPPELRSSFLYQIQAPNEIRSDAMENDHGVAFFSSLLGRS